MGSARLPPRLTRTCGLYIAGTISLGSGNELQFLYDNLGIVLNAYCTYLNFGILRHQIGFVAQIGLRLVFPLPLTDLTYSPCFGDAKCCETVEDGGTDLDLGDLPIEVTRGESLTKQSDAMHLCFDAA